MFDIIQNSSNLKNIDFFIDNSLYNKSIEAKFELKVTLLLNTKIMIIDRALNTIFQKFIEFLMN
jgi:hypothetical protein